MPSNCSQCKLFNHHPNHHEDIRCANSPSYAAMWVKISSLDESILNALPIDFCRDFELNPSLEKKEIDLTLTFQSWQQLARDSDCSKTILGFLKDKLIEHSLSLTVRDWQAIANNSNSPQVLETLKQQGIEPEEVEEHWHDIDSSCIDAIAFNRPTSTLSIRFNSREVYEYSDVASDTFQDFLDADSKGRFFNQCIKDEYSYNHIGFAIP